MKPLSELSEFGKVTRPARQAAGITLRELGKLVGVSGVTLCQAEIGTSNASKRLIEDVAKALSLPSLSFKKCTMGLCPTCGRPRKRAPTVA